MTEVRTLPLAELQAHPWQVNVPDITGREWAEFRADIESRGVQEPIRVSLRTGVPVIVDGHQRVRAAREVGYSHIPAMEAVFADEGEEVKFLSSAAQYRRHLTVMQRADIGLAREAYFSAMAAERKGGRPKKQESENLESNGSKFLGREGRTSKQAADAVGLSEKTYQRAKTIIQSPAAPVIRQAVDAGELSVSAGATLARRAGTTVNQAMIDGHLNALQAAEIERNKDLKRAVESGEKSPQEAVKVHEQMKAALAADNKARGTETCIKMEGLLTEMEDALNDDLYMKVLTSRYNAEEWNGDFAARWQQLIRRMQDAARRAEVQAQTVDAERAALN
ncbi:ParB/RepB/Spo0J family partition protein [Deinococcus sp. HMF7604]|uniref:ParB/RepB/Spo0J family partition protein n=1 Tax=Deinococcus betulae TaxID=2873312 RepID=UPI001CCD337A|nr:ParB/RepB/Spo0J family partition protein [Deinococcus betulae]